MIYQTSYHSPLGPITLASDGTHLIGLWFENQKYYFSNYKEESIRNDELKIFRDAKKWLYQYFNQENPDPDDLLLKFEGSDFRCQVWNILRTIPYGKTMTYGEIAHKIAKTNQLKSMSSQAVGNAVGHNPISIIIPCHRVIGSNNSLVGYAGGIDKKIKLLELEGLDISQYSLPKKH